jgi:hypothetical protein
VSGYTFALMFGILTVLVMLSLLRSRHLREKYVGIWMVVAVVMLVFALFPGLLERAADLAGIITPLNLALFVSALALLVVCVQYSVELSRLEARIRTLAEEIAILRTEFDEAVPARNGEVMERRGTAGTVPDAEDGREIRHQVEDQISSGIS